jgi:hypothetical protein
MSKFMKKLTAIFLMCLFVIGMLVVPAVHNVRRSSSYGHGGLCFSAHPEIQVGDHNRSGFTASFHQKFNMHDSSTCPICQLASISLSVPNVLEEAPALNRNVEDKLVSLSRQYFTTPRFLPFSCGPPVCCS